MGDSPEEMLALIAQERAELGRRRAVSPVPTFAAWGLAWLAGFGACYLAATGLLPWLLAGLVLGVLVAVAVVVPIVRGARAASGVRGPSRQLGLMYGLSWVAGPLALSAINSGLGAGTVPWTASAMFMVGLLYLAGGMLWRDLSQYLLGLWVLLFAAISVHLGSPGNFLVLSLAGGGGMLVQAGWLALRGRR
ncbi:hypothetical protein BC739_007474 [Kutzneria viridogrisea]|uniref:Uncharacterized protein n=2 Tax=Kutzneria TaxID=43356 RepID=A0ABR6BTK3_9PSEU|nr:hypothetical protein [Kutzneria albida]MBA8930241.1 hypothetical protein [Kutzneria viridogrisea]